ncbi:hypothetical protein NMK34_07290 [Micromonospora sp. BRA006-A]|uniref:hypothetical protein n=1 Tax=Micromonospora TaxID=1873 RepID=UPI00296F305B|nr:hypothetical protein [Micromonospora sp. BRA006-A]MDW3846409.1 hypothetical protein [Micromonospora sp. BRA006-A]
MAGLVSGSPYPDDGHRSIAVVDRRGHRICTLLSICQQPVRATPHFVLARFALSKLPQPVHQRHPESW